MSSVPCHGCTECCRGYDPVWLMSNEIGHYQSRPFRGHHILAHRENGDCIYLGSDGCTIHERRPHVCRWYDCRVVVPPAIPFGNVRQALIEAMERARQRTDPSGI